MTTLAKTPPVHETQCPDCRGGVAIFQARGKRAYLYARCACGFSQKPHDTAEQSRLWNLLPAEKRDTLTMPRLLAVPAAVHCPCCGKPA